MDTNAIIAKKYRVLRRVGKGGMGAVYEAVHVETGRHVAVKVMHQSAKDADASEGMLVERFKREARVIGSLASDNIVSVLDAGVDDATGHPYMVMDLLVGEDVNQLIKRVGPLAPDLALRILAQTCVGLAEAHDRGIVHRDIKPGNLFLSRAPNGEVTVKVLDFGVAKLAEVEKLTEVDSQTLTQAGMLIGSPHYMSPEQAKGLKTIDQRADVWSLGVVLFKSLTCRTPHDNHETIGQVIVAICFDVAPSVQNFAPWITVELDAIVHRALQLAPAARYQTAREMLTDVTNLLPNGLEIHANMLRPMTDEQRALIAPRRSSMPQAPPGIDCTIAMPPPPANGAGGGTTAALDVSTIRSHRQGRVLTSGRMIAGGALTAALLTGAVFLARPPVRPPRIEVPTAASATAQVAPPPSSGLGARMDAPNGSRVKTVSLAVSPPGASVEVDGVTAAVTGGKVALVGDLGSVHKVRLMMGKRKSDTNVVITERGSLPDHVSLVADTSPLKPADPSKPRPTTGGTTTAAPTSTFDQEFK